MYDNETRNQFIELRAQGLSLDAISVQLSVSKTTLGRWHHECLEQIQRLRALQWHLLEDQIGERLEDTLRHIAQRIRKWDDKLDKQLDVYQKPGDSIRVIRESRREYLQLRAILLAPLQPARRNAPCLTSVDSEKRDKTGQNPDARDTTPLPPNDLQQPETSMSHSAPSPEPMPESATLDGQFPNARAFALPLPGGEGWGEGQTSTLTLAPPSSEDASPALNLNPDPSSASQRLCGETPTENPKSKSPPSLLPSLEIPSARFLS